ncbi:energy transducer TonB [Bacteroidota bacterium]
MTRTPKYKKSGASGFYDYSEGKLSDREANAFERMLQQDPFEEEAAEGLSMISREEAWADLQVVRNRINRRLHRSRRMVWMSAAAAIVTILVVTTIFIKLSNNPSDNYQAVPGMDEYSEEKGIEETTSAEKPNDEAIAKSETKENSQHKPISEEEESQPDAPGEQSRTIVSDKGAGVNTQPEQDVIAGVLKAEDQEELIAEGIGDFEEEFLMEADEPAFALEPEVEVVTMETRDEMEIAAAAPAMEKGGKGSEEIAVPVSLNEAETNLKEENYSRERKKLSSTSKSSSRGAGQLADSGMTEKTELNEVEVAIDETSNRNILDDDVAVVEMSEVTTTSSRSAYPVMGKTQFKEYLDDRLAYPDSLQSGKKAVVVLTFSVLQDGSTDNFEVIKSPSNAFSEAAISTIKYGPEWIPALKDGVYWDKRMKMRLVFRKK